MKNTLKIIGGILLFFVVIIGLSYGLGWNKVLFTKTVGKAQQNAEREVFEENKSFVDGKRSTAFKYYHEYQTLPDSTKQSYARTVALEFKDFDEDKYFKGDLRNFIHNCKYKLIE